MKTATLTPNSPFTQGLPRDTVLRLLSGAFSQADYRAYLTTGHWRATKVEALEHHGQACVLCDAPATEIHHRPKGYRHLFHEDVQRHLVPLCSRCHRRHHRK